MDLFFFFLSAIMYYPRGKWLSSEIWGAWWPSAGVNSSDERQICSYVFIGSEVCNIGGGGFECQIHAESITIYNSFHIKHSVVSINFKHCTYILYPNIPHCLSFTSSLTKFVGIKVFHDPILMDNHIFSICISMLPFVNFILLIENLFF